MSDETLKDFVRDLKSLGAGQGDKWLASRPGGGVDTLDSGRSWPRLYGMLPFVSARGRLACCSEAVRRLGQVCDAYGKVAGPGAPAFAALRREGPRLRVREAHAALGAARKAAQARVLGEIARLPCPAGAHLLAAAAARVRTGLVRHFIDTGLEPGAAATREGELAARRIAERAQRLYGDLRDADPGLDDEVLLQILRRAGGPGRPALAPLRRAGGCCGARSTSWPSRLCCFATLGPFSRSALRCRRHPRRIVNWPCGAHFSNSAATAGGSAATRSDGGRGRTGLQHPGGGARTTRRGPRARGGRRLAEAAVLFALRNVPSQPASLAEAPERVARMFVALLVGLRWRQASALTREQGLPSTQLSLEARRLYASLQTAVGDEVLHDLVLRADATRANAAALPMLVRKVGRRAALLQRAMQMLNEAATRNPGATEAMQRRTMSRTIHLSLPRRR